MPYVLKTNITAQNHKNTYAIAEEKLRNYYKRLLTQMIKIQENLSLVNPLLYGETELNGEYYVIFEKKRDRYVEDCRKVLSSLETNLWKLNEKIQEVTEKKNYWAARINTYEWKEEEDVAD